MTEEKNLRVTHGDYSWSPKYYGVIVGLFCSLYMITMVIAPKIINIYGITVSAALLVFPLCTIISDILTEVYGFNRTRQAIWTVIIATILFTGLIELAVMMPAASFWGDQAAFEKVFKFTWRIMLGGLAAWVVAEFTNTYVMSKMKVLQKAKNMSVRFIASTIVAQFFDTLVFSVIVFAGTMAIGQLITLMLIAWVFKVVYETCALPISLPVTNWIKRLEGVEHFDKEELRII